MDKYQSASCDIISAIIIYHNGYEFDYNTFVAMLDKWHTIIKDKSTTLEPCDGALKAYYYNKNYDNCSTIDEITKVFYGDYYHVLLDFDETVNDMRNILKPLNCTEHFDKFDLFILFNSLIGFWENMKEIEAHNKNQLCDLADETAVKGMMLHVQQIIEVIYTLDASPVIWSKIFEKYKNNKKFPHIYRCILSMNYETGVKVYEFTKKVHPLMAKVFKKEISRFVKKTDCRCKK